MRKFPALTFLIVFACACLVGTVLQLFVPPAFAQATGQCGAGRPCNPSSLTTSRGDICHLTVCDISNRDGGSVPFGPGYMPSLVVDGGIIAKSFLATQADAGCAVTVASNQKICLAGNSPGIAIDSDSSAIQLLARTRIGASGGALQIASPGKIEMEGSSFIEGSGANPLLLSDTNGVCVGNGSGSDCDGEMDVGILDIPGGARIDNSASTIRVRAVAGGTVLTGNTSGAIWSIASAEGTRFPSITLPECGDNSPASEAEPETIATQAGGGGTYTKVCVCQFDGTTYRWYGMTGGGAGNATTCP